MVVRAFVTMGLEEEEKSIVLERAVLLDVVMLIFFLEKGDPLVVIKGVHLIFSG